MKYVCYWELCPEDMDKVIPLFQKMQELRGTKDYPKGLAPAYTFAGQMSGFSLYAVDDPQQITNFYFHYHPLLKMKWKLIEETTNTVATYTKLRK